MYLIFDTETTGFIKQNADHDAQPYMVQLAGLLLSETGEELDAFECIVKRDGWEIPQKVAEIHGITNERSDLEGIPLADAIAMFDRLVTHDEAKVLVAHNIDFDIVVVGAAYHRAGLPPKHTLMERICTMKRLTDVVGATKSNGQKKWPKLMETHTYYFGEGFDDAHSALADVRATGRCLMEALKRGDL